MFASEFAVWWWLGVLGAFAAVAVFIGPRWRGRSNWRAVQARIAAMPTDRLDTRGAAWLRPRYVSTPLARIAASRDELVIVGRWWWVPIPPTVVERQASRLRLTGELLHRRFDLDKPEGKLWLTRDAATRLAQLGWTPGDSSDA